MDGRKAPPTALTLAAGLLAGNPRVMLGSEGEV